MVKKEDIIFDIDGVLLNYLGSFISFMKNKHNIMPSRNNNYYQCYYDFSDLYPNINICNYILEFSQSEDFENILPIYGSQNGLELISKKYHINAITSAGNHEITKKLRMNNLKKIFNWQDDWVVNFVTLGGSKEYYLNKYKKGTIFIDDLITNLIDGKKASLNTIWFKETKNHILKDSFEEEYINKFPITYGWKNLLIKLEI